MADANTTYYSDPTLHTEHAAIRHDIGLAEANIRDAVGATKYTVATEAAALSKQIGAEACGINQQVGETKYKVAEVGSDVRNAIGETKYKVSEVASDIRAEQAMGFDKNGDAIFSTSGDTRRELQDTKYDLAKTVLQEGQDNMIATKDARFEVSSRLGAEADRIVDRVTEGTRDLKDRFFTVGRDLADLRQGQATLAKDIELNALKTQIEGQKNTQYLADKIVADGEKTRGLINDLKYHDLNRALVERQAELVACENDRRDGWRRADQVQYGSQWAQLQSQVQAFQSQLQETRQGMVNFGTMAGVGQSSTSNNVR